MDALEFPRTYDALKKLQSHFKCESCGILADNPCTLGVCEHIFCKTCCNLNLEKNECPICGFHVDVKDAHVNRQIFNLFRLCQRLENVLTGQDTEDVPRVVGKEGNDVTQDVPQPKCEGLSSDGKVTRSRASCHGNSPGLQSAVRKQKRNLSPSLCKKAASLTPNTHGKRGNILLDERTNSHGKKRNIPLDQRTMTQMLLPDGCEDDGTESEESSCDEEVTPVKKRQSKGKRSAWNSGGKKGKGQISHDQTTMSQFFDYISDSDVDSDSVAMEIDEEKSPATTCTSKSGKKTTMKAVKPKGTSHNLRTRVKSQKSAVENSPGASVSSNLLDRSPALSNQETPTRKTKPRRHSMGGITRVQELRDDLVGVAKSRKSWSLTSPVQGLRSKGNSSFTGSGSPKTPIQGQRSRANSSFTGSGKKSVDPLLKRNAKGETPLQVAVIKGDKTRVEELLKAGATPNTRDNAGWTPLHEAVHYGHTDIAEMLLAHGAMINVPGTDNDTPLHDALRQGQLDCVKLLVSHGACITSRNIDGFTPEDFATTEEMKEALKVSINTNTTSTSQEVDVLEYQQPCLLPTGLSRDQKITVQKCAALIHGRVVDEFCPEVTHIVTSCNEEGMCPRTFKYLHGVLNGKWIVKFDWVEMCIDFGSKVCEEAFEIPGTSQNIESHAAEKGRTNRVNQLPKLFEGYKFYFHGNFQYPTPDKDDLMELVKSGGGQILSREPKPGNTLRDMENVPYHAPTTGPLSKCCIFVVRDNNAKFVPIRTETLCSVSVAWFLDCIGMFRIQSTLD